MSDQSRDRLKGLNPPNTRCTNPDCPCKSEDAITVQLDVKDYE